MVIKKAFFLKVFVLCMLVLAPVSSVLADTIIVPAGGQCPPGYHHYQSTQQGDLICAPNFPQIAPPTNGNPSSNIPARIIPRIFDLCWDVYDLYCEIEDIFEDE